MITKFDKEGCESYIPATSDDLERRAYVDLARYIRFLAGINQVYDHWSMNVDDLTGEGFYALAKAIKTYLHVKPYDEFIVIAKTCIKNAIRTVRRKGLMTRRKQELDAPSLDDEDFDVASNILSIEEQVESSERITNLLPLLSTTERRVLNALLGGEERVVMYLGLRNERRTWIFKDAAVALDSWVISRAICEPVEAVDEAFAHIAQLLGADSNEEVRE